MIPYSRLNALIYIPYPRVNCLKTTPFTVAHTYIAHIWKYPPPPSLGKQLTFCQVNNRCPVKWHLRNERSGTTLIWIVLLVGWKFASISKLIPETSFHRAAIGRAEKCWLLSRAKKNYWWWRSCILPWLNWVNSQHQSSSSIPRRIETEEHQ